MQKSCVPKRRVMLSLNNAFESLSQSMSFAGDHVSYQRPSNKALRIDEIETLRTETNEKRIEERFEKKIEEMSRFLHQKDKQNWRTPPTLKNSRQLSRDSLHSALQDTWGYRNSVSFTNSNSGIRTSRKIKNLRTSKKIKNLRISSKKSLQKKLFSNVWKLFWKQTN